MKHRLFSRICALALTLCLLAPLASAGADDTYLPDGEVTHADFSLGLSLHADGFPASAAHLADWETFLNKLRLRGSTDILALFTPDSRTYLKGALQLNGKDQIPFVLDGYHSYRYLISPALNNEPIFFQMHNFLEFMLKPYYYMELPTQYLALLLYPDAAWWIGDSYYTPVAELLASARQAALNGDSAPAADSQSDVSSDDDSQAADDSAVADDSADSTDDSANVTADDSTADVSGGNTADSANVATDSAQPADTDPSIAVIGGADGPTSIVVADSAVTGTLTYTIPYEDLYELCENLDLIVNDDTDLSRAYFFFTCLLTDAYASDATLEILGALENELDNLDPDAQGMTVTETPDEITMAFGDTQVFHKTTAGGITAFTLTLPTAEGYTLTFDYRWDPTAATGATLSAALALATDGAETIRFTADGQGLPRTGDLSGNGSLTLAATGSALSTPLSPVQFAFDWSRDAAEKPYTLNLNLDWIHPQTQKPALSLHFNGKLSTVDKSVFVEGSYPQNDFFNLNETFLDDYKARLLPTLALKLAPIVLEAPAGVIDDLYRFANATDILVSIVE